MKYSKIRAKERRSEYLKLEKEIQKIEILKDWEQNGESLANHDILKVLF